MDIVSVLVCTRNRPADVVRAARSLLADRDPDLELIVVDQSDGRESGHALAALDDSRLRYFPSQARGKGAALNQGLALARGEVVACTDDDCEAPPGWTRAMASTLAGQPTAAVCFCNVTAPPHDESAGYVPAYQRHRNRLVRSTTAFCFGRGLGAAMAVRRDAVLALGGFDEALGPGGRFPSGDDWDIATRAILRGWHVYETAELSVVHHGFRSFAEGREHARRDWIGIGALSAKPLKAGQFGTLPLVLWQFGAGALWPPLRDLLSARRPRGLTRVTAFLQGFARGLRTPVDRKTLLFAPRG